MHLENMDNIDDIECIRFDGPTFLVIISEYKELFNDEHVSLKAIREYFGSEIQISEEFLNEGFEILRAF